EQQLIKRLVESHRQKQDAIILKALKAHIPQVTLENFGEYAHRLTQSSPKDKPYPIQIFLDYGTSDETLVCELQEPELIMGDNKATGRTFKA
uniref:hypothetical protein n=1 Tax=Spirosoma sp. TaxID=1899569 RepID=UPI003B3B5FD9